MVKSPASVALSLQKTEPARSVVPETVPRKSAVSYAKLVAGVMGNATDPGRSPGEITSSDTPEIVNPAADSSVAASSATLVRPPTTSTVAAPADPDPAAASPNTTAAYVHCPILPCIETSCPKVTD